MFNIKNFSPTDFDPAEITILYRNIDDNNMKLFNQAILEMKLSKNNFCEMVTQLIRDKDIFEKLTKKPILYIGFINSNNIRKNDLKDSNEGLNKLNNCIIFGIKDKMFNGKNVNKFYNWREIAKTNKLEKDVKLLGNEVNELRNEVKELRNEVTQIRNSQESQEKKIDDLKNLFLNFAREYEINSKNIFDNKNKINNSSNSCNMLNKKRKHN
jgi:hypothetical protein